MRVLVAPDKFKGSLSAREICDALAAGLGRIPGFAVESCPMADGGEGFADALAETWELVDAIRDPLGRLIEARLGWTHRDIAVIEMSEASGMRRLSAAERDPWRASTFGAGQLIRHAAAHGASRILVGLGGSATNDAGAGAASALGWQFLTSDGEPIEPRPENFFAIERIEPPETGPLPPVVAACDVRNPLLGPEGAAHVYARQKGADDRMIDFLEAAVAHLADLVADQVGVDHRLLPGAGAAGGLGYGLATFCGAAIQSGFGLIAESLKLEAQIAASDLVVTGEGRFDAQAFYGKVPVEVARIARALGKPVALVCGQCDAHADAGRWFDFVIALDSIEPDADLCMRDAAALVAQAGARIGNWFRGGRSL